MNDKPTIIFLDYFEDPQKAVPKIRKILSRLGPGTVIVSSNADMRPFAAFSDIKMVYFDELLDSQDYVFMDQYIFRLAENWYKWLPKIEGVTRYKQIDFGEIAEEKAQRIFTTVIKNLEIILKINGRFKPGRIVFMGEKAAFNNLGRFIKEELKIPVSFVAVNGEKAGFLSRISIKSRSILVELILSLVDEALRRFALFAEKDRRGIFIDFRLYSELAALPEGIRPHFYLIEKGIRPRLNLLRSGRRVFMPLFAESSIMTNILFNPLLFKHWRAIKKDNLFKKGFAYRDVNIWPAVEGFVKDLIIFDFLQARRNVIFLEKAYAILRPKLVVLREAVRAIEKTVAFTARMSNIPSLVIQHGILAERNVYTRLHSDWIALWGPADINQYAIYGNDTAGCVVTGKPLHDKMTDNITLTQASAPGEKAVLYIADCFKPPKQRINVYYHQDAEHRRLKSVLAAMEAFPDKRLIIKPHPFDPIDNGTLVDYQKRGGKNIVIAGGREDIIQLIRRSDLVIVANFSSATLDAVILGKPVIILNFFKCPDLVPYADRGVAVRVTRPEEIYSAIKRVFDDEKLNAWLAANRKDFIYDYAYKVDGKSNERVLALIRELYEGTKDIKREESRNTDECIVNKSAV